METDFNNAIYNLYFSYKTAGAKPVLFLLESRFDFQLDCLIRTGVASQIRQPNLLQATEADLLLPKFTRTFHVREEQQWLISVFLSQQLDVDLYVHSQAE